MKNLAIIGVVAWLLFFGGMGQLKSLLGSAPLASAPQTIIQGAARVAQTAAPAPARQGAPVVNVSRPAQPPARIIPASLPALPTATPEAAAAALPWCEDVPAGAGITACQWRDAAQAQREQQHAEQEALAVWVDMADQAATEDLRADPATPTAQVPTECENPPNARARASCELIKRGIIHPKG